MGDVTFKGYAGLRNDVSPERFEAADLAAAVNVDLDDSGRLARRDGYVLRLAAADVHSLWSDGSTCLFVEAGTLKRLHKGYTATTLRTGIGDAPVSYVPVNGRVYYSNGTLTGIIDQGAPRSWGIVPPGLPLGANAGGQLAPGRYQYALTYVREDGQESGTGLAGLVEVTTGGIALSEIPVSADPAVTHKILYVTPQDGDVLYRAAILPNEATSYTWAGGALSLPLATQYMQEAPAGEIVAYHYGRLYVVSGSNVFYSQPYGYELFDPRDFLPFDAPVRIFAPVEGGVWVGTEREIAWLPGEDPDKMQKVTRAEVGSVKGTLAYVNSDKLPDAGFKQPDAEVALWWSDDGVVAGYPSGALAQLTNKRYRPGIDAERGTGIVRQLGNSTQYLAIFDH